MNRRTFLQIAAAAPILAENKKPATGTAWTQWGGPNRNFQTDSTGLKEQWPATGPKVMWKRPLGEGFSSAAVDGNTLYTMYGKLHEEVVLAADATTGKTLWEYTTPITFRSDAAQDMGNGPYTTPLL